MSEKRHPINCDPGFLIIDDEVKADWHIPPPGRPGLFLISRQRISAEAIERPIHDLLAPWTGGPPIETLFTGPDVEVFQLVDGILRPLVSDPVPAQKHEQPPSETALTAALGLAFFLLIGAAGGAAVALVNHFFR